MSVDLLTFLAEHPNHVYTKEELFREIWDMDSIGDIATVTVHIKKIREKIEFDSAKPQYIETIWGVGYRFKVQETVPKSFVDAQLRAPIFSTIQNEM